MMTVHEQESSALTTSLKQMVLSRGGLKSYFKRAEALGFHDCDLLTEKNGAYIEVTFVVRDATQPGYYRIVLGPQGRVVSKESQYAK